MKDLTVEAKAKWRTDGVIVARAATLNLAMSGGRATAFDFAGADVKKTWMGTVSLRPNAKTGAHHHGRTEVAVYVVKELRSNSLGRSARIHRRNGARRFRLLCASCTASGDKS
jgi:uncharacterized RmlC-like cupin family protein